MNLANPNTVKKLMGGDVSFKKSLGQNFLIDESVCPRMASEACDKTTGALEIGPGIGVLTRELAAEAKKVVTIELDRSLERILKETLADLSNTKVIFGDAMKLPLAEIIKENFADCERVVVWDDNASIDVPPLFKGKAIDCKKHGNIRNGIVKHIIPVGEGRLKGRFDIFVDIEYQKRKGADHEQRKAD